MSEDLRVNFKPKLIQSKRRAKAMGFYGYRLGCRPPLVFFHNKPISSDPNFIQSSFFISPKQPQCAVPNSKHMINARAVAWGAPPRCPFVGLDGRFFVGKEVLSLLNMFFFVNNEYWQYGRFKFLKIFVRYILEFVVSLYARAVAF